MKSIFQSKTAGLGLAGVITGLVQIAQELQSSGVMPGKWAPYVELAIGILVIINRLYTTEPVTIVPPKGGAAVLLVGLLLPGLAAAAPPTASITGPSGGIPGDAINLDGAKSKANVFRWDVVRRGYSAADTHFSVAEDGKSLQINSYPGVYDVTLSVANDEGIDVKRHVVVVWGVSPPGPKPPPPGPDAPPAPPGPDPAPNPTPSPPAPAPGPNPTPPQPQPTPTPPTPAPEPVLPDGKFGAARFARDAALQYVAAGTTRPTEAAKLAGQWEGVAAAINAGTVRGILAITAAMKTANNTALGTDGVLRWKAFGDALATKLTALYASGALKTADDWATLINEGAAGLRAVK